MGIDAYSQLSMNIQAGWLAGCLARWLAGWRSLAARLPGSLLAAGLAGWLAADWLAASLARWLWLARWLAI